MKIKSNSDIPRTGRIGRFAKILEKEVTENILIKNNARFRYICFVKAR